MKRDWKLIRAILREEDTSAWGKAVVDNHQVLCGEAGYTTIGCCETLDGHIAIYKTGVGFLTVRGLDIADTLSNLEDLHSVLARLDRNKLGSTEDVVLSLMRVKASERLASTK